MPLAVICMGKPNNRRILPAPSFHYSLKKPPQTVRKERIVSSNNQPPRDVFAIVERGSNQRSLWIKVGVAFVNQDRSVTLRLHCVPLTGTLQVRERRSSERRSQQREPNRGYDRGNGNGQEYSGDDYPI